ncbi:MAG: hypothetical protein JJU11_01770, partial [Candidatus Sumerlaeia bacterium]|nr:hypothetical protein [Candidatus Sumerlaeia bacterium]
GAPAAPRSGTQRDPAVPKVVRGLRRRRSTAAFHGRKAIAKWPASPGNPTHPGIPPSTHPAGQPGGPSKAAPAPARRVTKGKPACRLNLEAAGR